MWGKRKTLNITTTTLKNTDSWLGVWVLYYDNYDDDEYKCDYFDNDKDNKDDY